MRITFDTNIIVYAADPVQERKCDEARALIAVAAQRDAVITQQVVGEFLNVTRRSAHLNQRRLRRIAVDFCAVFPVIPTHRNDLFDAFDLAQAHQLQFWDAVILTVCKANDVATLITEDMQDGATLNGVTILNPFNPANRARLDAALA